MQLHYCLNVKWAKTANSLNHVLGKSVLVFVDISVIEFPSITPKTEAKYNRAKYETCDE